MRGEPADWDLRGDELAADHIARGRPTAWFDRLYAEGLAGSVSMPWDRTEPHPLLRQWAETSELDGAGRKAVVVGCGLGADAAYVASLGFTTVGFDISPTAVSVARERHGAAGVDFRVADLLELPSEWSRAFDVVVEIFTIQALPDPPRGGAIAAIVDLVAPGGTLLAIAFRNDGGVPLDEGPPFALTRETMESLAVDGLQVSTMQELTVDQQPRWRVEYHRPLDVPST